MHVHKRARSREASGPGLNSAASELCFPSLQLFGSQPFELFSNLVKLAVIPASIFRMVENLFDQDVLLGLVVHF